MGKSRYAKTKSAGDMVGLTRYGKQFGKCMDLAKGNNRTMRRIIGERKGKAL